MIKTCMLDLITKLTNANIPFEARIIKVGKEESIQICYPSVDTCMMDAICHQYSSGGQDDRIEILGYLGKDDHDAWLVDDAVGWLEAQEAFEYFNELHQYMIENNWPRLGSRYMA